MSDAEKAVLDQLESCLPGDWIILHSLWLKNHPFKAHAEVDFVVISNCAVLLLETKGGIVWRDGDLWHFQTKSGSKTDVSREGPFDQVRGAYYTLKNHLAEIGRLDLFHDIVWGYGVIAPECVLNIPNSDAGIEPTLWLDLRGFPDKLSAFLDDLTEHWRRRCLEIKRNLRIPEASLHTTIPARLRAQLRNVLQPVLQPVRGLGVQTRQAEQDLRRLTLEQYRALDHAGENDRICLVGAAGTGKTILALEQALRQAEGPPSRKVLFLCYSRLLAEHLAERLAKVPRRADVEVGTYHQVIMRLLRRAGIPTSVPEDWAEFNVQLEAMTLEAIDRLESRGEFVPYDYIVLDEGQDLLHPAFFQVLDLLLRNGMERGRWLMCIDPGQAIFGEQYQRDLYDRILGNSVRASLSVNCRNTRQVAAYVYGLSGVGAMPVDGANGPDVKIIYYSDAADYRKQLRSTINAVVGDLDQGRLPPGEVAILTPDRAYITEDILAPGFFVRPITDYDGTDKGNCILLATVQAFKGLEANCIVLVGFHTLESEVFRRLLYVGGSRARTLLRLLLPHQASVQVQTCMTKILEAMSGPKLPLRARQAQILGE